jgi:hypothetical protein
VWPDVCFFSVHLWPLRRIVNLNSIFSMQWNTIVYCVFSKKSMFRYFFTLWKTRKDNHKYSS